MPNGVFTRALPTTQRPPRVDAYNIIVQRQLTDTMSIEAGYVIGLIGANMILAGGLIRQARYGRARKPPGVL